jgi:hypothetical protein
MFQYNEQSNFHAKFLGEYFFVHNKTQLLHTSGADSTSPHRTG